MKKLHIFNKKNINDEMHPVPPHMLNHGPEPHDPLGHHEKHTPPHLRKNIPLDDQEREELRTVLNQSFRDEDSAGTAFQIFQEVAPPEIQTLIFQISKLHTKLEPYFTKEQEDEQLADVEDCTFENAEPSRKFTILDPAAKALFAESYAGKAPALIEALKGKPNEIIEAAILLAWLYKQITAKEEE